MKGVVCVCVIRFTGTDKSGVIHIRNLMAKPGRVHGHGIVLHLRVRGGGNGWVVPHDQPDFVWLHLIMKYVRSLRVIRLSRGVWFTNLIVAEFASADCKTYCSLMKTVQRIDTWHVKWSRNGISVHYECGELWNRKSEEPPDKGNLEIFLIRPRYKWTDSKTRLMNPNNSLLISLKDQMKFNQSILGGRIELKVENSEPANLKLVRIKGALWTFEFFFR